MLVIFGFSNFLSDIFDCCLANRLVLKKVVIDQPEQINPRDVALETRLASLAHYCELPVVQQIKDFIPEPGELYLLGPTTPRREALADKLGRQFGLRFHTLIHPTAYVSPLAVVGQGVFIGATSVIAPGVVLADHVFINRGVSIGHDTQIGSYSRIQPGVNLGGLTRIGRGVTVGIGATVIERLVIGNGTVVAAGATVIADVAPGVLVAGVPAIVKKIISFDDP